MMLREIIGQFNVLFSKKKNTSNNIAATYNPFSQVRSIVRFITPCSLFIYTKPHDITSQKTSIFFIVIAVITSDFT